MTISEILATEYDKNSDIDNVYSIVYTVRQGQWPPGMYINITCNRVDKAVKFSANFTLVIGYNHVVQNCVLSENELTSSKWELMTK